MLCPMRIDTRRRTPSRTLPIPVSLDPVSALTTDYCFRRSRRVVSVCIPLRTQNCDIHAPKVGSSPDTLSWPYTVTCGFAPFSPVVGKLPVRGLMPHDWPGAYLSLHMDEHDSAPTHRGNENFPGDLSQRRRWADLRRSVRAEHNSDRDQKWIAALPPTITFPHGRHEPAIVEYATSPVTYSVELAAVRALGLPPDLFADASDKHRRCMASSCGAVVPLGSAGHARADHADVVGGVVLDGRRRSPTRWWIC